MTTDAIDKSFDYYMSVDYPISLTRRCDADEPYWVAELPDLPGCLSDGPTPTEAIQQLEDAKALWIETYIADGFEVPEPPDLSGFSGKLSLRIPKTLHRNVTEMARSEGVSLNQYISLCLARGLGSDERVRDAQATTDKIADSRAHLEQIITHILHSNVMPQALRPFQGFATVTVGTSSRAQALVINNELANTGVYEVGGANIIQIEVPDSPIVGGSIHGEGMIFREHGGVLNG